MRKTMGQFRIIPIYGILMAFGFWLLAFGQRPTAKSQQPRANGQEPTAKSQEPTTYKPILFLIVPKKLMETISESSPSLQ